MLRRSKAERDADKLQFANILNKLASAALFLEDKGYIWRDGKWVKPKLRKSVTT